MSELHQDIKNFIDANHELYSDIYISINNKITRLEINFGKSYIQKEACLVADRIKSNFNTFCLANNMRMFQYKKDHEYSLCYAIHFKIKAEYLADYTIKDYINGNDNLQFMYKNDIKSLDEYIVFLLNHLVKYNRAIKFKANAEKRNFYEAKKVFIKYLISNYQYEAEHEYNDTKIGRDPLTLFKFTFNNELYKLHLRDAQIDFSVVYKSSQKTKFIPDNNSINSEKNTAIDSSILGRIRNIYDNRKKIEWNILMKSETEPVIQMNPKVVMPKIDINTLSLSEYVEATNAAFKKANKARRRVLIVKDVLLRLDRKKIYPKTGFIVDTAMFFGDDNLKTFFNNKKCDVCAKGALFCSIVGRTNGIIGYDIKGLERLSDPKNTYHVELQKYFTIDQLDMIEVVFEGMSYLHVIDYELLRKCSIYRNTLLDSKKDKVTDEEYLLRNICHNIIKNNGEFIPE